MTLEEWVDATSKRALFTDEARPSNQVTVYDTLIGDVEGDETRKLETKNTRVNFSFSSSPSSSRMKKPLGQPSLSK